MVSSNLQSCWIGTCCIGTFLMAGIGVILVQIFLNQEVDGKVERITALTLPNEECKVGSWPKQWLNHKIISLNT